MLIAGVAMLSTSLLFVASPVAADASNAERLPEPAPTISSTSPTAVEPEFDQQEYVPSRLQQDEVEKKEIAAVALSFSDGTYGAVVMGYVADSRGMESQRQGTALVVTEVSKSDIEDLKDTASYFGGFEGVEVFYKDEVTIAGDLDVPASNDPLDNTNEYDAVDVGDLWADIANPEDDIIVAVLDTGVANTAELSDSLLTGYDATSEGDGDPTDTHGHGTFVAAQIAGSFNNEIGSYGICQQCKILPVQVLSGSGSGNNSWVAAGIRWAADNGADIISMSLGGPSSQLLSDEVAYAESKGIILVGAAGNNGNNWSQQGAPKSYPAAIDGVISVAASKPDGSGSMERASFSNFGKLSDGVDIAAPGCVFAAGLEEQGMCGTSMATPIVSSVIGLMLAQFPDLTGSEITDRLFGFASMNPLDYTTKGHIEGTGLLDPGVDSPEQLIPADPVLFDVSVEGAWQCTEVGVGHLPLTITNSSDLDARAEVVFAFHEAFGVPTYDTFSVAAGETISYSINYEDFPGDVVELYFYDQVGEGHSDVSYILNHNDCAGFVVEHLDLAPDLCHIVPGEEEFGLQRTTQVEYISSGKVWLIGVVSLYQKSSGTFQMTHILGNSHGELRHAISGDPNQVGDSTSATLYAYPLYTEPFYSDPSTIEGVTVSVDNPCTDSYLPPTLSAESSVDWETHGMYTSVGPKYTTWGTDYAEFEGVKVNFEVPIDMEVEVRELIGSAIYEDDGNSYDGWEWDGHWRSLSETGSVALYSSTFDDGYEETKNGSSSIVGYQFRQRVNDGVAKSEWVKSTIQTSVHDDTSMDAPVFHSSGKHLPLTAHWESIPTATRGTLVDYQITTGEAEPTNNGWLPAFDEDLREIAETQGMGAQTVFHEVPNPTAIGENVVLHIRQISSASTYDGNVIVDDTRTFTFKVPSVENDPVADDPVDEHPADDAAELVEGSRLTDTRNADGYGLPGGMIRYVQVAGVGDVPADATAATVNFTVAGSAGWGYLTAWSCDSANSTVPDSSILNYNAGWVRANTQTIGLGANGGICVWSYTDIDLLVDTQGFFNSPSVHMYTEPSRVADDRGTNGLGDYNAGEVRRIEVGNDAVAAFVNLTVVNAKEWGFLTAWPCESEYDSPPNASAANYDAGQTVANNALVSLNNGGFCVYSYGQTGVIVDLMGTIDENETSVVPLGSQRLVDTRTGASTIDGMHAGGGRIEAGQTRAFQITGRGNVPFSTLNKNGNSAGLSGVYLNVTSVNPQGTGGFLTIWACEHADEKVPNTSALNYNDRWSATPNSIVQKVNDGGQICIYAYKTTDVIVDVTGYVT